MKEQLHTIPIHEVFVLDDECPFCAMERDVEHRAIRYVVGPAATYMEPHVRATTGSVGFCGHHLKALFDYGNQLGAAMILQTHLISLLDEMKMKAKNVEIPEKRGIFSKKKVSTDTPYWEILKARKNSCYICDRIEENMSRYYETFFALTKEKEFREKVENCKGFCVRHFARLLQEAEKQLPDSQRHWFYPTVYQLMCGNVERVKEDLDWLIAKYDYRNAGAPWGNSQDALPRTMQKLQGIYPNDPPYKEK